MIKIVRASNYWLSRHIQMTFGIEKELLQGEELERKQTRKPYQILFQTSIEMTPKLPTSGLLRMLKARGITHIMAANHSLKHAGVLEAHIQCLFSLISRLQPSIEGVAMFTEHVYKLLLLVENNNSQQGEEALNRSLAYAIKPHMITKVVRIAYNIEYFYNEYMRQLIGAFIIKTIQLSDSNYHLKRRRLMQLSFIKKQVLQEKQVKIEEGVTLTPETLPKYLLSQQRQIEKDLPTLERIDFLNGLHYVLTIGYYTEDLLNIAVEELLRQTSDNLNNITNAINTIKVIVSLERYKHYRKIAEEGYFLFGKFYNKAVERYFQLLQNNQMFFEALHLDDCTIQIGLVTEFLREEHRSKAKVIYMQMLQSIFNTLESGSILFDVKKIRGFFELVLIMYTHEDRAQVYELLKQVEKAMVAYPMVRFEKLQTHCSVAQKYNFKSEIFASQFLKHLMSLKNKIDKNREVIHPIHQFLRQIHLASKFLTYLNVSTKASKEIFLEAERLASQLFEKNLTNLFGEPDGLLFNFLSSTSFANSIFFSRSSLSNLTAGPYQRKKIERILTKLQIKTFNKNQTMLFNDMQIGFNRFNIKIDHHFNWRHNPHARLVSLLKLAIHHYDFLKRKSQHQANNFMNSFLYKTVNNPKVYNIFKKNFAYPEVLNCIVELTKRTETQYPVLMRDLEAVKRLYAQYLTKASEKSETYNIYYQENLQDIEYNRVMLPHYQDLYGITGLSGLAAQGSLHQAMRRFFQEKQALRMEIQTFCKFQKDESIKVVLNYFEYPYIADLKVTTQSEEMVLLFDLKRGDKDDVFVKRDSEMQREAEAYWRKKELKVILIREQKDIERFMETKIKSGKMAAKS